MSKVHPIRPTPLAAVRSTDWVLNTTLWVLGGLVNAAESTISLANATNVTAQVSTSPVYGQSPLPPGWLPDTSKNFYVHIWSNVLKPNQTTDWQAKRGDKEGSTRGLVQARSKYFCALTNLMSQGGYDSEDSHQVTHLVARHCSPVAFEQFTVALEDLGVQCPALKTLVHQMNLLWLAKIAHGPMVRGKWSVFIPRFQVSVNGAVTTDSLEVHHFKNAVELDYSQRGGHTIHNAAKLINAARRPNAPPPTQTFAQSANGDSLPPLPPLAYMYTAADPLVANRRTSAYPQTILWRVNYAVACALRWGSDDIKALIFGWKPPPLPLVATPLAKKRKLETPGGSEATQEEEIADEAAEGDEEAAQDEDEEEAAERECMEHLKDRARVCEFVISNFLRTQEDSVMVVDLDQPLVS